MASRTGLDASRMSADQKKALGFGALAVGGVLGAVLLSRGKGTTPPPPPGPPTTPGGLAGTPISSTRVTLTWNSAANDATYNVYRDGILIANTSALTFSDPNCSPSTTYNYQVAGVNSLGAVSNPSVAVAVTTPTTPPNIPPTPTGLAATLAGTVAAPQVVLVWNPSAGATSYDLYRNGVLLVNVGSTQYVDTGVAPGQNYLYDLDARNSAGASATTAPLTVNVPPLPVPVPTGLAGVASSSTRVDLTWNAVSVAVSYNVYRDGVLIITTSAVTYSDPNASPQTTYAYQVSAVNVLGVESARSAVVDVTTPPTPPNVPPPPTGLAAALAGTQAAPQVVLTWNDSAGATSYDIYRNGVLIASGVP